jgi:subtilisin family serine protease
MFARRLRGCVAPVAALCSLSLSLPAVASDEGQYRRTTADAVVVQLRPGASFLKSDRVIYRRGDLAVVPRSTLRGWGTRALYAEPLVEYQAQSVPTDPYFDKQWGMKAAAGIDLPGARETTKGSGVIVAVIDTGIRAQATDFAGTAFAPGIDVVNNDADPTDDNGHGTHVAGTIAQTTDNGIGCAGVAPEATLLAIKALNAQGSGSNVTIAAGIREAVKRGARVINLSLGGGHSLSLQSAVNDALAAGVVIVAAAGNGGGGSLLYPAAYPGVISVGAVGSNGQRASFSQYGSTLSISAPGVGILQQTFSPSTGRYGYGSWNGTSMATPHVAGTAALVMSVNAGLKPADVKGLLERTATDLGAVGRDSYTGAGRVNAAAALKAAGGAVPGPEPGPMPQPDTGAPSAEAAQVLVLVNQERAKVGAPALVFHSTLSQAAQGHAADMAARGYFSHYTPPSNTDPGARLRQAGYAWVTYAENIAAGYPTAEAVVTAWMGSAGHRANILNARLREIGVGIATGGPYGKYWVTDFGAR